jgi:hypothetical protein
MVLIAGLVSTLVLGLASFQTATGSEVPSWATFPEVLGEFKVDRSRDLTGFGIAVRYKSGARISDVYLYRIPQAKGDGSSPLRLSEEAALTQQTLLKLQGQGYDRVELVGASLPLDETVGKERIEGIMVGAMLLIAGQPASTYTTLFNVRGYRLKIRTTIREHKPDIDGTITFVRTLLRAVLKGVQAG